MGTERETGGIWAQCRQNKKNMYWGALDESHLKFLGSDTKVRSGQKRIKKNRNKEIERKILSRGSGPELIVIVPIYIYKYIYIYNLRKFRSEICGNMNK